MTDKCIVKDCVNHKSEGAFIGELCVPCYSWVALGEGKHSQAYRNMDPVIKQAVAAERDRLVGVLKDRLGITA